jgi:predicted Fe-S protein YdhL (DUF1289 family)
MFDAFQSPCIGLCKMDEGGTLCLGCQRSLAEIAQWSTAAPTRKSEILAAVASRRASQRPQMKAASVDRSPDATVKFPLC